MALPVAAVVLRVPRLADLSLDGDRISFNQPGGGATLLDLSTGKVIERGGAVRGVALEPAVCDKDMLCTLSRGVLAFTQEGGFPQLELRSATGTMKAPYPASLPWRDSVWEVPNRLLIERTQWGASTLECVNLATLKREWVYVYPTLVMPSTFATMRVEQARTAMRGASLGTGRMDLDLAGEPTPVVHDPDPVGAEGVRRMVIGFWVVLGLLFAAWVWLTRRAAVAAHPMGGRRGRSWLAVLLAAAAGFLTCAGWLADPFLLGIAGLLFLFCRSTAKRLTSEAPMAKQTLTLVTGCTILVAVVVPLVSAFLISTMR